MADRGDDAQPYVPAYLRGLRRLPRRLPETIGLGDKDEAASYAAEAKLIWQQTPGALDWLAQVQQTLSWALNHIASGC